MDLPRVLKTELALAKFEIFIAGFLLVTRLRNLNAQPDRVGATLHVTFV